MPAQAALKTSDLTEEDIADINRSRMYKLLAVAFSFPGKESQKTQAELWALAKTLYPEMLLPIENTDMLSAEFESLYINILDGHDQKHACRPYESAWHGTDRSMQQWEVKKFYQMFGLGLNTDSNEMPDHITNELEFMHYLTHLAVEAGQGRLGKNVKRQQYVHAQRDFLQRHLNRWIPSFCNSLKEKIDSPFYCQLAEITERFVKDDAEYITEIYKDESRGS